MESLTKKSLASLPTLEGEFPYPLNEKVEEGKKCLDFSTDVKIGCLLKQGFYNIARTLIKDEYDQTMYDYVVNKKSLPGNEEFFYLTNYGFYQEAEKYAESIFEKIIIRILINPKTVNQVDKKYTFQYSWNIRIIPIYEVLNIYDIFPEYVNNDKFEDQFEDQLDNIEYENDITNYFNISRFPNNVNYKFFITNNLGKILFNVLSNRNNKTIEILKKRGINLKTYNFSYIELGEIFGRFINNKDLNAIIFSHNLGIKIPLASICYAFTESNFQDNNDYEILKFLLENVNDSHGFPISEVYWCFFSKINFLLNNSYLNDFEKRKILKVVVPIFLLLLERFPNISKENLKNIYNLSIFMKEQYKYSDFLNLLKEKFPAKIFCPDCQLPKNPDDM